MIACVTRLGLQTGGVEAIEAARQSFAAASCVHIKGFLAPDLVADLQRRITGAVFARRTHDDVKIGMPPVDIALRDHDVSGRVHFLLNDPALFRVVAAVTGCDAVGSFVGTIFKMLASEGHFDTWHSDADGNRMVALSVNLSEQAFEGGVLQIMDVAEERVRSEVANTGPGDAVLFQIAPALVHKVTDVSGRVPRTVLAGFFQREPQYIRRLPRTPRAAGA